MPTKNRHVKAGGQVSKSVPLDRRARRREKLLIDMERTRRRFEKADRTLKRLVRQIVDQERALRRLDKAISFAVIKTSVPHPNTGIAAARATAKNKAPSGEAAILPSRQPSGLEKAENWREVPPLPANPHSDTAAGKSPEPPQVLGDAKPKRSKRLKTIEDTPASAG